jgi:hypothetical protein
MRLALTDLYRARWRDFYHYPCLVMHLEMAR